LLFKVLLALSASLQRLLGPAIKRRRPLWGLFSLYSCCKPRSFLHFPLTTLELLNSMLKGSIVRDFYFEKAALNPMSMSGLSAAKAHLETV
jgi:hypothetical protein